MGRSLFISILAVFTVACGGDEPATDLGTSPDTSDSADMSVPDMSVADMAMSAPDMSVPDQAVSEDLSTTDVLDEDFRDVGADMTEDDMADMVDMTMPLPSIEIEAAVSVAEGGGAVDAMVRLTEPPAADVQVSFAMHPDIEPATVTIPAAEWDSWHALSIEAVDDVFAEIEEVHVLELVGNDVEPASFDVTITDNDVAEIVTTRTFLGQTWDSDRESFEVYLTAAPVEPVSVQFWPDEPSHYVMPMALWFDAQNWDVPQTVVVGIDVDFFVQRFGGDLGLSVLTSDPAFAQAAVPRVTTFFFDDDDFYCVRDARLSRSTVSEASSAAAPLNELVVELDGSLGYEFVVQLNTSDPSVRLSPSRFVAMGGNTSVSIAVDGDNAPQPPRLVAISFEVAVHNTGPTQFLGTTGRASRYVWVIDDDSASVIALSETLEVNERHAPRACTEVVLATPPADDVVVNLVSTDTSAFVSDSAPLVFDQTNFFEPQLACIRAVDDLLQDGDQNAILQVEAASNDPSYNQLAHMVSVIVTDDETIGFTHYRRRPHVVPEPTHRTSFDTLIFANTAPIDPITAMFTLPANVRAVGALEEPGGWFAAAVGAEDDEVMSGIEQLSIPYALTTTDPDYMGFVSAPLDITRVDTDLPGGVVTDNNWLILPNGGAQVVNVGLRTSPSSDVTIPVEPHDATRFTAAPAVLTFTPTNWDTPQAVTVTAVDDITLSQSWTWLTLGPATSSDAAFHGKYGPLVQLTRN